MNGTSPALEQSREIFFEGIGHFEAGRLSEARACFERCLALTPDRPSVQGNLGVTLFRLGHPREALPYLQNATAGEPSFGDAWAALGLAHETQGDWAAAQHALTQALALSDTAPALWFGLAQCQSRLGRAVEALKSVDRAVALDPAFADAWSLRGGLQRELHRLDDAAHSFERAIALGADRELHAYYLASVRGGPPPTHAPRQYVQALFDDYAADFQRHLVEQLGYRGHEVLLATLVASGRRWRRVIDLGCGTGLCGALLQPTSDAIDGVDLSGAMLEQARGRGVYRTLAQADIVEFLAGEPPGSADLVVAADVLIYVGALAAVFEAVARVLEPGGRFAFTVELPTNGEELQLLPSLRYSHSQGSVRRLAQGHGLAVDELRSAAIRREQGRPVQGLYVTLRRAGPQEG
jgi:predicted TPR repeat methyltransferase